MNIAEYSPLRAAVLNKTSFPEAELPLNLKILWIELVDKLYMNNNILKGLHQHSFFEIHFVFSGNVLYSCGGEIFNLGFGDAILLPAETEHCCTDYTSDVLKGAIAFSLDESAIDALQIRNSKTKLFHFSDNITVATNFILKQIESNDVFTKSIISNRTFEMLYSLLKSCNLEMPKDSAVTADPRFLVAKAFIENNTDKIITCSAVAKECCLSTKHLCRIFKSELGTSPSEYITSAKIRQAKKLLANNKYSIKEIGFMLGFDSESSFASFFKRHCHTPPGAFRKQMSQN